MRTWARRAVAAGRELEAGGGPGVQPLELVGAIVARVARELAPAGSAACGHLDAVDPPGPLVDVLAQRLPEPPGGWADPWLPGLVHEQAVSAERRSARGAWYTPEPVVRGLLALATADGVPPPMVVDPTCGGGAFLLAALDRYVELGVDRHEAMTQVAATDIDPDAVRVSRWSVRLWAAANGVTAGSDGDLVELDITVGDALDGPPGRWRSPRLVVGNPPFATPLRSGVMPAAAEALREANRDLLGPYTDLAAIHLLAALRSVGPGSTVALVQPQSVLSGRDTAALRRHCDREAPLHALWAARRAVFDAGVRACAVVLRPGTEAPQSVTLAAGIDVATVPAVAQGSFEQGHWAGLAARALGAPVLPAPLGVATDGQDGVAPVLGDLATATAGFRDEYYGLLAACREWEGEPGAEPNRLVTVGAVDPLVTTWGRRPVRFGGRSWWRPVIDVEALEPRVRGWTGQRLTPKVVLATQSKVLEPVVDRVGTLVPATPLIAVTADPAELDRVAAVLLAPPVVAWAWQRWFGAALAVDALKLAASQVLELPLPPDLAAWDEAAALLTGFDGDPAQVEVGTANERAVEAARIMNRAYGASGRVFDWWLARAGH